MKMNQQIVLTLLNIIQSVEGAGRKEGTRRHTGLWKITAFNLRSNLL